VLGGRGVGRFSAYPKQAHHAATCSCMTHVQRPSTHPKQAHPSATCSYMTHVQAARYSSRQQGLAEPSLRCSFGSQHMLLAYLLHMQALF
jgi:hypothetical protein